MFDELGENERFMAEIVAFKLCRMACLHHGFGQSQEASRSVAGTADISIDDFQWSNTESDCAAMLTEAMRGRVTELKASVMKAKKVE
jgi:hypothetical protein